MTKSEQIDAPLVFHETIDAERALAKIADLRAAIVQQRSIANRLSDLADDEERRVHQCERELQAFIEVATVSGG